MSKQKQWRAAWPHVTVRIIDETTGAPTVVAFGEGGILPPSADPEDVKRLAAKGALVEVESTEPAKPQPEPAKAKTEPKVETKADAKTEPKTEPKSAKAGNG